MHKIWVVCTNCSSDFTQTFFGAKSIGFGKNCPTCDSNWKKNQIIAATVGGSSAILGDIRIDDENSTIKVVWLNR